MQGGSAIARQAVGGTKEVDRGSRVGGRLHRVKIKRGVLVGLYFVLSS